MSWSILSVLLLAGLSQQAPAATRQVPVVAISLDIPPYVIDKASRGLEVDIVREALGENDVRFIQLPYEELQTAVQQRRAEVSAGVQPGDPDVFYSADFVTFANYAISKKADGLRIDSVADLKGHPVLTWENAYLELGGTFQQLFSPQSPQRKNYLEVADQEEQVRRFWEGQGNVIVIDRGIFVYFSKESGHEMSEVDFAAIFPPVTPFKVGFQSAEVRDLFDKGLATLCRNGDYLSLLKRYDVDLAQSVCP